MGQFEGGGRDARDICRWPQSGASSGRAAEYECKRIESVASVAVVLSKGRAASTHLDEDALVG
jgi:hypothetical protein